ncbi:protein of unknown function [Rhodovastum atsumiense]|nr:protein of unknown function [Rhodovastum atsumiense]
MDNENSKLIELTDAEVDMVCGGSCDVPPPPRKDPRSHRRHIHDPHQHGRYND